LLRSVFISLSCSPISVLEEIQAGYWKWIGNVYILELYIHYKLI